MRIPVLENGPACVELTVGLMQCLRSSHTDSRVPRHNPKKFCCCFHTKLKPTVRDL